MMRGKDQSPSLPSISKSRLKREYKASLNTDTAGFIHRNLPPLAFVLGTSIFGQTPKEGFVKLRVLAEKNVQIFVGFPSNNVSTLFRFTGETTARKIVNRLYPMHKMRDLSFKERFRLADGVPSNLNDWLKPIPEILRSFNENYEQNTPLHILNFHNENKFPKFVRYETLSGQVPDGNHRILAYTILAHDYPEYTLRVRILSLHPAVLAVFNIFTLLVWVLMDPFHAPRFIRKRFS